MGRYQLLDHVANGFNAAHKIRQISSTTLRQDGDSAVTPGRLNLLNEILGVICEYAPEPHKRILNDTLFRTTQYSHTYRNLKKQMGIMRKERITAAHLTNTLDILKPVLNNQNQVLVDKVLKIYEIIHS